MELAQHIILGPLPQQFSNMNQSDGSNHDQTLAGSLQTKTVSLPLLKTQLFIDSTLEGQSFANVQIGAVLSHKNSCFQTC